MRRAGGVFLAIALGACDNSGSTGDERAAEAYFAIVDSLVTRPDSGYRVGVSAARLIAGTPAASSEILAQLELRGIPMVAPDAPLCEGEMRVVLGPLEVESRNVYQIEVDIASISEYGFGDATHFKYRVDCRGPNCSATGQVYDGPGEIAGGCR
jgi:hypothetical protein